VFFGLRCCERITKFGCAAFSSRLRCCELQLLLLLCCAKVLFTSTFLFPGCVGCVGCGDEYLPRKWQIDRSSRQRRC
jgi:hypothetical protein